jgi:RNA polymerase sigma factor (sigma-70 family)
MEAQLTDPAADAALARGFRDLDPAAFARVVDRYDGLLHRIGARLLASGADVDDAVQATWARVAASASSFDPGLPLDGWLVTILRHECRRARRSRRTRGEPLLDEHVARWGDPERCPRFSHETVRGAVRRLTKPQRAVVLLVVVYEHPASEAALLLDVPEGALRQRLHKARVTLRRELAHEAT